MGEGAHALPAPTCFASPPPPSPPSRLQGVGGPPSPGNPAAGPEQASKSKREYLSGCRGLPHHGRKPESRGAARTDRRTDRQARTDRRTHREREGAEREREGSGGERLVVHRGLKGAAGTSSQPGGRKRGPWGGKAQAATKAEAAAAGTAAAAAAARRQLGLHDVMRQRGRGAGPRRYLATAGMAPPPPLPIGPARGGSALAGPAPRPDWTGSVLAPPHRARSAQERPAQTWLSGASRVSMHGPPGPLEGAEHLHKPLSAALECPGPTVLVPAGTLG